MVLDVSGPFFSNDGDGCSDLNCAANDWAECRNTDGVASMCQGDGSNKCGNGGGGFSCAGNTCTCAIDKFISSDGVCTSCPTYSSTNS